MEHGESVSPRTLRGPNVSGSCAVLLRRKTRRGADSTAGNGLATLAGERASGISVVAGPEKDLASTSGSRPSWIFLL